jgi:hypothetical protein
MRKTVIAAIATCAGAPILALGVVAAPAAWAVPGSGGCSSGCGGANPDNPGNAQGGRLTIDVPGVVSASESGTFGVVGGQTTGRVVENFPSAPTASGTVSGNFNTIPSSKGHCTGGFTSACS